MTPPWADPPPGPSLPPEPPPPTAKLPAAKVVGVPFLKLMVSPGDVLGP